GFDRVMRYEAKATAVQQERARDEVTELLVSERQNETRLELISEGLATSHAFGDVDADAKEALDARYPKERVRRVPRRSILIARLRRERILPDDATLEKIMRFETHLSR